MKEILFLTTVFCFFSLNYVVTHRIGTESFKVITTTRFFVDKTMLIKEFFRHRYLEISAPTNFGRTLNMDMLKLFYEIQTDINGVRLPVKDTENYKIFNGKYNGESLKIRKESEFFDAHFGKYPVIHVNFERLDSDNLASFTKHFSYLIHEIIGEYEYLFKKKEKPKYLKQLKVLKDQSFKAKLNKVECAEALQFMSMVLSTEFNEKVIFLIEGYDMPIQKMIFNRGEDVEEITKLIGDIIGNVLKGDAYVKHSLLNSCIKVAYPFANNIQNYLFTGNKYFSKYYGFTTEEVEMLLSRLKIEVDRSTFETWYNGYTAIFFDGNRTQKVQLYNPVSISEYCEHEFFDNYWARPTFRLNLSKLLFQSNIFDTVCALLEGNNVTIVADKTISIGNVIALKKMILTSSKISAADHDLYFHMLLQLGYLTITDVQESDNKTTFALKIPNGEIRNEIKRNMIGRIPYGLFAFYY